MPDESGSNKLSYPSQYHNAYSSLPVDNNPSQSPYSQTIGSRTSNVPQGPAVATGPEKYPSLGTGGASTSDANLLLGLNAAYSGSPTPANYNQQISSQRSSESAYNYTIPPATQGTQPGRVHPGGSSHGGDVLIETQDIDMSTLQQQNNLPFALNGEVLPWLEYLPQDVLSYFGDHQSYPSGSFESG